MTNINYFFALAKFGKDDRCNKQAGEESEGAILEADLVRILKILSSNP